MYADELTLQPDARMFHLACPAGVLLHVGPRSERRLGECSPRTSAVTHRDALYRRADVRHRLGPA